MTALFDAGTRAPTMEGAARRLAALCMVAVRCFRGVKSALASRSAHAPPGRIAEKHIFRAKVLYPLVSEEMPRCRALTRAARRQRPKRI